MMTPPLSIWARPFLVAQVEVSTVMWLVDPRGRVRGGCPCEAGPGVLARSSRPGAVARPDYRTRLVQPQTCCPNGPRTASWTALDPSGGPSAIAPQGHAGRLTAG